MTATHTWATHATTHRATAHTWAHATHTASVLHHFTSFLASEDVETIDYANHTIAVYTIVSIY